MPDGKEHEIPLPQKTFSSGREGYYAQVPGFVYENEVYGGQIQIWKKGDKAKKWKWTFKATLDSYILLGANLCVSYMYVSYICV